MRKHTAVEFVRIVLNSTVSARNPFCQYMTPYDSCGLSTRMVLFP